MAKTTDAQLREALLVILARATTTNERYSETADKIAALFRTARRRIDVAKVRQVMDDAWERFKRAGVRTI